MSQLDGLRAIAVLLVVGTHTGCIPGGYLGVDAFFVLSGYLITGTLLHGHRAANPSLKTFYLRRARRLYPALLLLLIVTLPFGPILGPGAAHYAAAAAVTAVYLSDFVAAADIHWLGGLVHTWSLAVEEQFYLLWPLVLAALRGRSLGFVWTALPLAATAMLALLSTSGSAALYLPFARGGVLLLGCMLALALDGKNCRWPTFISLIGAAAFLAAVLCAPGAGSPDAGRFAAIAGLAATALIAGLAGGGLLAQLLSIRPLVWLGRRSYAIYLWHVPIVYVVARRQLAPARPEWGVLAVALIGSIGAAAFSYSFVESRFLQRPILISDDA